MALRERKLETIDWSKSGVTVAGFLLQVSRQKYQDGSVGLTYVVRGVDETRLVFKGATNLNLALSPSDVGKFIEVRYMGEDQTKAPKEGMNRPKLFRVSVDDERTLAPVAGDSNGITDADIPF